MILLERRRVCRRILYPIEDVDINLRLTASENSRRTLELRIFTLGLFTARNTGKRSTLSDFRFARLVFDLSVYPFLCSRSG